MRIRREKWEVSNSMPRDSEPILVNLFICNLNEDIEGPSGKSAHDKWEGHQDSRRSQQAGTIRQNWQDETKSETHKVQHLISKNPLKKQKRGEFKSSSYEKILQILQTVGPQMCFVWPLKYLWKTLNQHLKIGESHVKIQISGFSWKTDRSGKLHVCA